MNHLLFMGHVAFSAVLDVWLLIVLILNIIVRKKMKRTTVELLAYQRDKAPLLVNALEAMAGAVCPLCAINNSTVAAEVEAFKLCVGIEPGMTVEAECDGRHVVTGKGSFPCRAAQIRADARSVVMESMNSVEKQSA